MNLSKKQGLWFGIVLVVALLFTVVGVTYSFFTATATDNTSIGGTTYNFDMDLEMTTIRKGTELIPFVDEDIVDVIASVNPCVDNGYDVCSIYRVVVTNNGNNENLHAFVKTNNSTYITNNFKARLFTYTDGNYTAVSDAVVLNNAANSSTYFKTSSNNSVYSITGDASNTYYFVVWVSEIYANQPDDQDKTFNGSINFESVNGDIISATFS